MATDDNHKDDAAEKVAITEGAAPATPHDDEPAIAEPDRVNVGVIAAVTFAIVLTTVAVVIAVQQFVSQTLYGEINKKVLEPEDPAKRELAAVETAKLSKYQWVNQKDGVVRIPTARAKELVLAHYGNLPAYEPGKSAAPAVSAPPADSAAPATSGSVVPADSAAPAVSGMPSAAPAPSGSAAPGASAPAPSAAPSASAAPHH